MKPLTQKQIECLRIAAQRDVNPFDFGSTTFARLKREGLIALVDGARARRYRITDAGRAELAAPTTMQKVTPHDTSRACQTCGRSTPYTDWTHCEEHNPYKALVR